MREIQPAGSPLSLVENVLDSAPQRLLLRQRPLAVAQAVVAKGPRVLVGAHDCSPPNSPLLHSQLTCDFGRPGGSSRPATRRPTAAGGELKLLPACQWHCPLLLPPSDPPQQTHGSSNFLSFNSFSQDFPFISDTLAKKPSNSPSCVFKSSSDF